MALNRIQFQKGLSLSEFLKRYATNEQCEDALVASRWPQGFVCPRCEGTRFAATFNGRRLWECLNPACRYQCSAMAGTVFQDTKLPLSKWFLALYLLSQAKTTLSSMELMRLMGVSYPSALLMRHKLMQVMREREALRKLDGRVEVDDAYLGGEHPGRQGRGDPAKWAFVTAVSTNARGRPVMVRFDRVHSLSAVNLSTWAKEALAPSAYVVSDAWTGLRAALSRGGYQHERHTTGSSKSSAQLPQFRWVNTLQGNLKTALAGTLHAFNFKKYGQRYLAEFAWRFNRRTDLKSLVPRLLYRSVRTPPRPADMLRLPESG